MCSALINQLVLTQSLLLAARDAAFVGLPCASEPEACVAAKELEVSVGEIFLHCWPQGALEC